MLTKEGAHGNHGRGVVDVSNGESSKAGHGSVDSACSQMRAHSDIMGVGGYSSYHVGGVDVLEGGVEFFGFAVRNNLFFQEFPDVL